MTSLENNVMASVRMIYAVRALTSATALKVYALALSAVGIIAFVSVSHVTANFTAALHGGFASVMTYLAVALMQTKIIVQLALLVATFASLSLLVDLVRRVPVVAVA